MYNTPRQPARNSRRKSLRREEIIRTRILPVLDVQNGVVVRGAGGRRHEYRPLVSRLTPSCRPADVALAYRDHFGLLDLYLADLDAIGGSTPAWPLYADLRALGFRLWVDAGVREPAGTARLAEAGVDVTVIGLETLAGPEALEGVCRAVPADQLLFSLDLKEGTPMGTRAAWGFADARSVAARAVAAGFTRILVLDLARVGTTAGTGTEELCGQLVRTYPGLEVLAGGGVRDVSDLRRLRECGVAGVLVASALHDGKLTQADLASFELPDQTP